MSREEIDKKTHISADAYDAAVDTPSSRQGEEGTELDPSLIQNDPLVHSSIQQTYDQVGPTSKQGAVRKKSPPPQQDADEDQNPDRDPFTLR